MAYMNQERKAQLSVGVKEVLKRWGQRGTLSVRHYSSLVISIKEGLLPANTYVNEYCIRRDVQYTEEQRNFLLEIREAMMIGNHDNSDAQTDYFDVGWYIDINIV